MRHHTIFARLSCFSLRYFIILSLEISAAHVSAEEMHISPAGFFGEKGTSEGQLHNARSIACDMAGNIYVADTGNNRILKFSQRGILLRSAGGFGWGVDQFDNPVSISTSLGLEVYVSDSYNHRILRYDRDLNYISQYAPEDILDDRWKFGFPQDARISIHGDLFIIDGENRRLLRINRLGKPVQPLGGFEDSGNLIEDPERFAIGPDDALYVIDREKSDVAVLDYFGNYIRSFGGAVLKNPEGIAVSQANRIFVADAALRQVVVFSPEGSVLGEIGPHLIELGREFAEPADLAICGMRLYILDRPASTIYLFTITTE